MRQRGDRVCFHEPFGEAWYQGETPLWPRVTRESVRTPGLTLEGVFTRLVALAAETPVFIKDFPHYIASLWNDDFLSHFTHSFLIRDPAETIPSLHAHWPDFHEAEVGNPEQRMLFDRLVESTGTVPPVIDSGDLLEDPETVTRLWCEAVGICFVPEAMTWSPGPRAEVSWWDGGAFHANLRKSAGLRRQRRDYPSVEALPERVRAIHDRMQPHYFHLRGHRIRL